jgi:hypothetical protein
MTGIGVRVALLVACLAASGCTTYNPATGQYQTDPVATSALVGGIGLASGVALGAALSDNDCCWGGYHGGDVYVHNSYNRTVNYNKNVNYNRANVNRGNVNRGNVNRGRGGGWGGGGRGGGRAGGRGGGRRR